MMFSLSQRWHDAIAPPKLVLVLSGGGARGALQMGALRALWEAGIRPDAWVGTSIGAVNATYIAVHGFTAAGLQGLESAWHDAAEASLLPANYLWLSAQVLFKRVGIQAHEHRLRQFFIDHGVGPALRFADLPISELVLIATDLNALKPKLFGLAPTDRVLDGLLASTAIPPWVRPMDVDGSFLMDGGVASNLPIEPALRLGATEIIALDLFDPRLPEPGTYGFGPFFHKLLATVEQRQIDLELQIAKERGTPVLRLSLRLDTMTPLWDFSRTPALIDRGYEQARAQLAGWSPRPTSWLSRIVTKANPTH